MGKKSNAIKGIIIGVILIGLIFGYYYYLTNKRADSKEEESVTATAVQDILLYNLDTRYPPTPKEVVKFFGQITQCFYNENYTEEEFVQLAMKIQGLYDEELTGNKTQNQYIEDLRWDINHMKEQGIVISSYATSASTDVYYFSADGFDWARLYCSFTLRKGTSLAASNEIFLLRKDAEGHWKIYGWTLAEEE